MASASIVIKLTPGEYQTLLQSLRCYQKLWRKVLDGGEYPKDLVGIDRPDPMAHSRRVGTLLSKLGPD